MRLEEHWLLAAADPEKLTGPWPKPLTVRGVDIICSQANLHSVLPVVVQNIERLSRSEPSNLLLNLPELSQVSEVLAPYKDRLTQRAAMSVFLGVEAKRLVEELQSSNVESIILKGIDFATRLYARSGWRTFGDIDLLIRPRDWESVSDTMARLGYLSQETKMKHAGGYAERSWQHPGMPGATVEVHDNLVNSPTVRKGVSVQFDDLPLERGADGKWRATATGLLVIATVHAAASHSFEKIQHLSDIMQIARGRAGVIDENALAACAKKTGSTFSLTTALDVTARAFGDAACVKLLKRMQYLPTGLPRWFGRVVMTPAVVVRSQGQRRSGTSWRRQTLRLMLKHRR